MLWLLTAGLVLAGTARLAPPDAPDKKETGKTYQVPFRLTDTLHVLVRAKLNGKGPYNFILDTGAPALFIATEVGKQLGVEPGRDGWTTLERFDLEGGLTLRNVKGRVETPFQLEGMNGIGLAGATLHGIIGYNVLARFRLEFDFTKDKLAWTALDFDPPLPTGITGKGGAGGLDALGGVMKFMGALLGKQADAVVAHRGFLGVELADADGGVEVKAVLAGSPADRAGLKSSDRITHAQDKPVASTAGLIRVVGGLAPGQSVRLAVSRPDGRREVNIKLGEGL
jgi:hypothetical protein